MKKTKKILGSLVTTSLLLNKTVYAAEEVAKEGEGFPTKYIFMGVALLVIVLLLFLGYRMDSRGGEFSSPRAPKKQKKQKSKIKEVEHDDIEYTADNNVNYTNDNINTNDLYEDTEYEEDSDDTNTGFSLEEPFNEEDLLNDVNSNSMPEVDNFDDTTYGEEFDTSIIDGLDDEEDFTPTEPIKPETPKAPEINKTPSSFDETMIFNDFNNPIASSNNLENEIDELDNINDDKEISNFDNLNSNMEINNFDNLSANEEVNNFENLNNPNDGLNNINDFNEFNNFNNINEINNNEVNDLDNLNNLEESDPFIEELKNFKEPESDFEGFSVASSKVDDKLEKKIKEKMEKLEEKPVKKYTKVKKEDNPEQDFLLQMEENLKTKDEGDKKTTTRKTTTKKKKE